MRAEIGSIMGIAEVEAALHGRFKGTLEEGSSLAGFTTFRIGGPADLLAVPRGMEDLLLLAQVVAESGLGFLILGRGSNVLVSDIGFRGVVAVISEGLRRIVNKGEDEVYVEAGCDINRLVEWCVEREMGGMENLTGIPGTVGGAIRMNAGAFGSFIGDRVEEISMLKLRGGEVEDWGLTKEMVDFHYRHSGLEDDAIVYKVKLKLYQEERTKLESRCQEVLTWRKEHQPLSQPSAGSVFRNPEGITAAELIEGCGLKGTRVGEAMVSEKHANFIVNLGEARAADVYDLVRRIKEEVLAREGIELREEIKLVGEIGEAGA